MQKKTLTKSVALLLASGLLLSGCAQETEDPKMIIIEEEEEEIAGVVGVTYQDVTLTKKITLEYRSVISQDLSFDVEREKVEEVLVEKGDFVKAGQLLISLGTQDTANQIEDKEYEIKRMELQLAALEEKKAQDILEENFEFAVKDDGKGYTQEVHEDNLERIEESYRSSIENYQDSLYIAKLRLEELKSGGGDHQIYAPFDGVLTYVRQGLEETTTTIGSVVITIMDPEECYFFADKPEDARPLFQQGDIVTLNINGGLSNGDYPVELVDLNEEDALRFRLVSGGEDLSIALGTKASITKVLGERDHVLAVPTRALHKAGDITYVYIINELGEHIVRHVEVGLEGDTYTEIISGLEEGERIAASIK